MEVVTSAKPHRAHSWTEILCVARANNEEEVYYIYEYELHSPIMVSISLKMVFHKLWLLYISASLIIVALLQSNTVDLL